MRDAVRPIVVVGSINMDMAVTTRSLPRGGETCTGECFALYPGGKGANQAVAVARLRYPTVMIGRVGNDGFGRELRASLQSAGVDTHAVFDTAGSSGVASITVSPSGENRIVVVPGANGLLTPEDIDACADVIGSAGAVLAQLEIPLDTVEHLSELCAQAGVPFFLDPAPAQRLPDTLFKRTTWFTPNETEAEFYTGGVAGTNERAVAEALQRSGLRNVVLKLGARGAYVATADGAHSFVPSFAVTAVDSTAAGDCFNAAIAVALMRGRSPTDAAVFACAAASIAVTRRGAQTSMPSVEEVEQALRSSTLQADREGDV